MMDIANRQVFLKEVGQRRWGGGRREFGVERALASWGPPIFILFLLVTLPSPSSRSLTLLRTPKYLIPDPGL